MVEDLLYSVNVDIVSGRLLFFPVLVDLEQLVLSLFRLEGDNSNGHKILRFGTYCSNNDLNTGINESSNEVGGGTGSC